MGCACCSPCCGIGQGELGGGDRRRWKELGNLGKLPGVRRTSLGTEKGKKGVLKRSLRLTAEGGGARRYGNGPADCKCVHTGGGTFTARGHLHEASRRPAARGSGLSACGWSRVWPSRQSAWRRGVIEAGGWWRGAAAVWRGLVKKLRRRGKMAAGIRACWQRGAERDGHAHGYIARHRDEAARGGWLGLMGRTAGLHELQLDGREESREGSDCRRRSVPRCCCPATDKGRRSQE